jgi:hypothetical protein
MLTVIATWGCGICPVVEALVLDTTTGRTFACWLNTEGGDWACQCLTAPEACTHTLALAQALDAEVTQ